MHGIRRQLRGDLVGANDLRVDARRDAFLVEAAQRVLGCEKLSDLPLRIGQRQRHRVPAIENNDVRR
jgi:hypothetical protein